MVNLVAFETAVFKDVGGFLKKPFQSLLSCMLPFNA